MKKDKKLQLTFGSDPELMLVDASNTKIVSALRVLKQNKHNPIMLDDGKVKMYADNVLVETSFGPASSVGAVVERLRMVFALMQQRLGDGHFLLPRAAHIYDEAELGPKPEVMRGELPEEWEIGCNPSFDVYERSTRVPTPFTDGLRTGSFHIHIGNARYKDADETKLMTLESKEMAVKLMDIFVGCSSILFDHDETSHARRALYGKAGEWRSTPYGIEYRVLGNYALRSPALATLVFDLTNYAMGQLDNGHGDAIIKLIGSDAVKIAINQGNTKVAREILREAELPYALRHRVEQHEEEAGDMPNFYKCWAI